MIRSTTVRISAALAIATVSLIAVFVTGDAATATQDMPILAGQLNDETSETTVRNTNAPTAVGCTSTDSANSGLLGCGSRGVEGIGVDAGVVGLNNGSGVGVAGHASDGTGVLADSAGGTALQVQGKIDPSRSGEVTLLASANSNVKPVVLDGMTRKTFVIATLQSPTPGVWVRAVTVPPGGLYFKIVLNKVPPSDTRIAWIAIN